MIQYLMNLIKRKVSEGHADGLYQEPPAHVHEWKAPEYTIPPITEPFPVLTRADFGWLITGQECACGARRIYEGPAFGWRALSAKPESSEPASKTSSPQ